MYSDSNISAICMLCIAMLSALRDAEKLSKDTATATSISFDTCGCKSLVILTHLLLPAVGTRYSPSILSLLGYFLYTHLYVSVKRNELGEDGILLCFSV